MAGRNFFKKFFQKVLTNLYFSDIIKSSKERKVLKMTNLNKRYYDAVKRKDWEEAKILLDKITKIEMEGLKAYYQNLGCLPRDNKK